MALCTAIGAVVAQANPATALDALTDWSALRVPLDEPADDPFARLTDAQLDALREIVVLRTLRAGGREPSPAARERVAQATQSLRDEGIDVDGLLALRDLLMAQRRESAEAAMPALDGRAARLAGYLVPLTLDGGRVHEFLLVPWAGACSHAPPPPPNQVFHVRAAEPLDPEYLQSPVEVEGLLRLRALERTLFVVDGLQSVRSSYAIDGGMVRPLTAKAR